jgi:hypothetical protein
LRFAEPARGDVEANLLGVIGQRRVQLDGLVECGQSLASVAGGELDPNLEEGKRPVRGLEADRLVDLLECRGLVALAELDQRQLRVR